MNKKTHGEWNKSKSYGRAKLINFQIGYIQLHPLPHSKLVELKSSLLKMHCMLAYHR